ncbi:UDP-N-acetylglucosamine 2-epimerase [Maridesulfovibrio hydrothermalis]|uniref:UDP-N-acetyl-D-glucosamine 2-epimerase, UDP-hydrolysing n=1 Tax=Maridesulfovibrio hydrothermalis AM13 = DSM 14728 TaxID=1121451 RepID=L0RD47_9BACT|nr:UDP-N-acetylglucosamine 2-epimerase [Maridesulfovibrio hydrothermalis]CCO23461.1 UDP-N-acetyl-D-glucosamine 2-epimerase, UDP-hydrolysing [Maridesulfovibrio hydrothermalis AM13 = DSM 14728]
MKKIVFLTGTRADFGKLKSLIFSVQKSPELESHVFVTGMHMLAKYGPTHIELDKAGVKNMYKYINQRSGTDMDVALSNTIIGFSNYVHEVKPDLIIVHGDRVEALAGAIVGSFNTILVGHIEGGEISGTIDEFIRHSITKLANVHFVSNKVAAKRLVQMGENADSIFEIGSPDIDVMLNSNLPGIASVKKRYEINFDSYKILLYHPVTTELLSLKERAGEVVDACIESGEKFVVIYPNNDKGTEIIFKAYEKFHGNDRFRLLPSMRFEFFLSLLKHSTGIVGNSSAGIGEAGVYGVPAINVGSRQYNRSKCDSIVHAPEDKDKIIECLKKIEGLRIPCNFEFGDGKSTERFMSILDRGDLWKIKHQKQFVDIS